MNLTYFKKSIKKNPFIAFGIADKNGNMYSNGKFTYEVDEFQERIKEMAYGCEVLIDVEYLQANGMKPITDKTTIVACDNVTQTSASVEYKYRRNMKFILKRDIGKYIQEHETRRSTPLFISLTSEYMDKISILIDIVEYVQVDRAAYNKNATPFYNDYRRLSRVDEFETKKSASYVKGQADADRAVKGRIMETIGNMKLVRKVDTSSLLGFTYKFIRKS